MWDKLSWLWDAGPPKEEEPPKKKMDKFSLMSENVQKIHKNLELQKEISKLRQIIEEKERDLAVAWIIKHPFYPSYPVLEDSSLDNRIESLQTELAHLKDKLKQLEENLKE